VKGPRELLEHEDHWVTRMGKWFPGERTVFRGRDLHRDLGRWDWMRLHVFGITGREYSDSQIALLNAIWVDTSYPDPRLWNNRVAALSGSSRSTGSLALTGALAASEASIYGQRPCIRVLDLLLRAQKATEEGMGLDQFLQAELRAHRCVAGYGRPVVGGDERIPHLFARAEGLGIHPGKFVQLALRIETSLLSGGWKFRMNYAALAAAFCADLGFTAREFYLFTFLAFLAGMVPCYLEASRSPEAVIFPLRCSRIAYTGPGRKHWVQSPSVGGGRAPESPI
jgi:hypothetical protein